MHNPSMNYLASTFRDQTDGNGQYSEERELQNTQAVKAAVECDMKSNRLKMHAYGGNMSDDEKQLFEGVLLTQMDYYRVRFGNNLD